MRRLSLLFLFLPLCSAPSGASAQTFAKVPPAVTTATPRAYRAEGTTDQPFTIEVLDAHRTVSNSLLLRLALTNRGTAPMDIKTDFAGTTNAAENGKISALYIVDPNGRRKYTVQHDAGGQTLCSKVDPALLPGERRELTAQLEAPPETTSTVDFYFPKATAIPSVLLGVPQAGVAASAGAGAGNTAVPTSANPVPPAPPTAIDQPTSNNQPDVYTNQTNPVAPGTPLKAIGSVQSANSTVPFTVEAVSLKSPGNGRAVLALAFTNGGSGVLDAAGQFTSGVSEIGDAQQISGVYLVDPASRQRFDVVRESQTRALCSKIDPAFGAGERRTLEAIFPPIPANVKMVYVYFPHAAPITDVPVTR